jgi:hypothetical protein
MSGVTLLDELLYCERHPGVWARVTGERLRENSNLNDMVRRGWVQWREPLGGYVITDAGRAAIPEAKRKPSMTCPHCGGAIPIRSGE